MLNKKTKYVIILDNGGCSVKIGYVKIDYDISSMKNISYNFLKESGIIMGPICIPNCIIKSKTEIRRPAFVGDQIDEISDKSSLYYQRPLQKGYLVGWELQKQILDRIFRHVLPEDLLFRESLSEAEIIITVPPLNFPFITQSINEVMFEEYGFASVLQITPSTLSALRYIHYQDIIRSKERCVVVDSGFSFTHVGSYFYTSNLAEKGLDRDGGKASAGAGVAKKGFVSLDEKKLRRLDVGGKLLTNELKEIISYRQLHVLEETYVIDQVKEDVCYVSQNFSKEMELCSKFGPPRRDNYQDHPLACEYILPDFQKIKKGFIKRKKTKENGRQQTEQQLNGEDGDDDDLQSLLLANERITIPEILFNPTDVGISQMGIQELVVESLGDVKCDLEMANYLGNVVLTGGNTKFKGFGKRFLTELRKLAPTQAAVSVYEPENPDLYAWEAGALLPILSVDLYESLKLPKTHYFSKKPPTISLR